MALEQKIIRHHSGGIVAPGEPCGRCGVRADVGCKHRGAHGVMPLALVAVDKPGRKGNLNSRWGRKGNPTADEFARYSEAATEGLRTGERDDD